MLSLLVIPRGRKRGIHVDPPLTAVGDDGLFYA
jgi:hypothetical protein